MSPVKERTYLPTPTYKVVVLGEDAPKIEALNAIFPKDCKLETPVLGVELVPYAPLGNRICLNLWVLGCSYPGSTPDIYFAGADWVVVLGSADTRAIPENLRVSRFADASNIAGILENVAFTLLA